MTNRGVRIEQRRIAYRIGLAGRPAVDEFYRNDWLYGSWREGDWIFRVKARLRDRNDPLLPPQSEEPR